MEGALPSVTRSLPVRLALFVIAIPFFAGYGAYVVMRSLWAAYRFVRRSRAALARTIRCPNGHPNSSIGRFECASCGATYHGWVGRCSVCGAGASWIACERCGVGIPLPWEGS